MKPKHEMIVKLVVFWVFYVTLFTGILVMLENESPITAFFSSAVGITVIFFTAIYSVKHIEATND